MDNPTYHTRNYFTLLKDTLQKQEDDLNWAKSKRQNLLAQLERTSINHIHKKQKIADEITLVQNQIDIFERMVVKSRQEMRDYEDKHRTSTQANKYKRYSLKQKRAWAKGGNRKK